MASLPAADGGDEFRWKLQYLDLSRLDEGVINRDERFGYLELMPELPLAQAVQLDPETGLITIAALTQYHQSGQLHYATINQRTS